MQLSAHIEDTLVKSVLEQFTKDRNDELVDMPLLNRVIKIFVHQGLGTAEPHRTGEGGFIWTGVRNLTLYTSTFEAKMIQHATQEHEKKARMKVADLSAPDYLHWSDRCYEKELGYCHSLLEPESELKLMTAVEFELITKRNTEIITKNTGVKFMLDNLRLEELSLLYKCFSRNPENIFAIVTAFNQYVLSRGTKIIEDPENLKDHQFCLKLLDFQDYADNVLVG